MEKQIKEINKLLDIQRELKDHGVEIKYHGLKDLNDDGYPFFVQWGHKLPILTIGSDHGTKFLELPLEIAFAIEKMMGNVGSEHDFELQIETAFKRKETVF